jgi:hypothetical protein
MALKSTFPANRKILHISHFEISVLARGEVAGNFNIKTFCNLVVARMVSNV